MLIDGHVFRRNKEREKRSSEDTVVATRAARSSMSNPELDMLARSRRTTAGRNQSKAGSVVAGLPSTVGVGLPGGPPRLKRMSTQDLHLFVHNANRQDQEGEMGGEAERALALAAMERFAPDKMYKNFFAPQQEPRADPANADAPHRWKAIRQALNTGGVGAAGGDPARPAVVNGGGDLTWSAVDTHVQTPRGSRGSQRGTSFVHGQAHHADETVSSDLNSISSVMPPMERKKKNSRSFSSFLAPGSLRTETRKTSAARGSVLASELAPAAAEHRKVQTAHGSILRSEADTSGGGDPTSAPAAQQERTKKKSSFSFASFLAPGSLRKGSAERGSVLGSELAQLRLRGGMSPATSAQAEAEMAADSDDSPGSPSVANGEWGHSIEREWGNGIESDWGNGWGHDVPMDDSQSNNGLSSGGDGDLLSGSTARTENLVPKLSKLVEEDEGEEWQGDDDVGIGDATEAPIATEPRKMTFQLNARSSETDLASVVLELRGKSAKVGASRSHQPANLARASNCYAQDAAVSASVHRTHENSSNYPAQIRSMPPDQLIADGAGANGPQRNHALPPSEDMMQGLLNENRVLLHLLREQTEPLLPF
jgi:hypothetical protein